MSKKLELKQYTHARIQLQSTGHSLSTKENLQFQWSHAQARDAIHTEWNYGDLLHFLEKQKCIVAQTKVKSRKEYLVRPDLGRVLNSESIKQLEKLVKEPDILLILSNGLSSQALHSHAIRFLEKLLARLKGYSIQGVIIPNARVAISDPIGELLKAKLAITLVGERPGLSSPDSMGLYLTYEPRNGKTDADRNCISNIREPQGLSYELAASKAHFLMEESLRRRLSGVNLKDTQANLRLP